MWNIQVCCKREKYLIVSIIFLYLYYFKEYNISVISSKCRDTGCFRVI